MICTERFEQFREWNHFYNADGEQNSIEALFFRLENCSFTWWTASDAVDYHKLEKHLYTLFRMRTKRAL